MSGLKTKIFSSGDKIQTKLPFTSKEKNAHLLMQSDFIIGSQLANFVQNFNKVDVKVLR